MLAFRGISSLRPARRLSWALAGRDYYTRRSSAEDLQPLTREDLEQEYRVEECDGLLWVYDPETGELVFLFAKAPRVQGFGPGEKRSTSP
jgi:hypothetical protein